MIRYIGIYSITLLLGFVFFFFIIPIIIGADSLGEVDTVIGILLIMIGSFIITQLFYLIDIFKDNKR